MSTLRVRPSVIKSSNAGRVSSDRVLMETGIGRGAKSVGASLVAAIVAAVIWAAIIAVMSNLF